MNRGRRNFQSSMQFIHALTQLGISQAVISPGSRSTPLTLACIKHPAIKTHTQIDERCAGFFALGLAQQSDHPVLLICTSGTAVANWYPAIIEASYSKTAIILLSADRPDELQNCGANQTIDQQQMFAHHVRYFHSIDLHHSDNDTIHKMCNHAYLKSIQPLPGPVHINLPFTEPLLPTPSESDSIDQQLEQISQEIIAAKALPAETTHRDIINPEHIETLVGLIEQGEGLIICGSDHYSDDAAHKLMSLASHLQAPLLAEPLSNFRFGSHPKNMLIHNYDSIYRSHQAQQLKPDWILRFGSFPVSRSLADFLALQPCACILVEAHGQNLDPIHGCQLIISADAAELCQTVENNTTKRTESQLLKQLYSMNKRCQQVIDQQLEQQSRQLHEAIILQELLNRLPDDCLLFSGNSMPIRDINSFITGHRHGNKTIRFACNRGASGIDGNLSSFAGHLVHDKQRPAIALLGDLTFYHDMNGLLKLRELSQQAYNGTVIILNNNGGNIFSYLPQHNLSDFSAYWLTSTDLDFSHAADLYSLNHHKVTNRQQLIQALEATLHTAQVDIIEIILTREHSVKMHQQLWQQIIQQLEI